MHNNITHNNIHIERGTTRRDWEDSMVLAWETFLLFEADDYTPEGIRNFNDFVTDPVLYQMYLDGDYVLFVAKDGDSVIGMITLRSFSHISLLFVDEKYHFMGIGSALIERLCRYLRWEKHEIHVTVNAAPYGIGFYHKLGFVDTEEEISRDGIRITPMERKLI